MSKLQEYIKTISDNDKILVIKDYETLEEKGELSKDALIRKHLDNFLKQSNLPCDNILLGLDRLAMEAYRYFAKIQITHIRKIENASINMDEETYKYNLDRIERMNFEQLKDMRDALLSFFKEKTIVNIPEEEQKKSNYYGLLLAVDKRMNYLRTHLR